MFILNSGDWGYFQVRPSYMMVHLAIGETRRSISSTLTSKTAGSVITDLSFGPRKIPDFEFEVWIRSWKFEQLLYPNRQIREISINLVLNKTLKCSRQIKTLNDLRWINKFGYVRRQSFMSQLKCLLLHFTHPQRHTHCIDSIPKKCKNLC